MQRRPKKGQWLKKIINEAYTNKKKLWQKMKPVINPYEGVVIPGIILTDSEIPAKCKLLYGVICSLSVSNGYCLTKKGQACSIEQICTMLNIHRNTAASYLNLLQIKRYIVITRYQGNRAIRPKWVSNIEDFEIEYILQSQTDLETFKNPYEGISIPNNVVRMNSISDGAKLLYGFLFEKTKNRKVCRFDKSQAFIALHKKPVNISKFLKELVAKDLIEYRIRFKMRKNKTRKIFYIVKMKHNIATLKDIETLREKQKAARTLRLS
jgi:hypothetical protein